MESLEAIIESVMPFSKSSRETLRTLYCLAQILERPIRICEIGSHRGASAIVLYYALESHPCRDIRDQIVCIDNFSFPGSSVKEFEKNVKPYIRDWNENVVRLYPWRSVDVFHSEISGQFGMAFIDGDHSYMGCKLDIELIFPRMFAQGMICGHDYGDPGVRQAVQECFPGSHLLFPGDVWVAFKRAYHLPQVGHP